MGKTPSKSDENKVVVPYDWKFNLPHFDPFKLENSMRQRNLLTLLIALIQRESNAKNPPQNRIKNNNFSSPTKSHFLIF